MSNWTDMKIFFSVPSALYDMMGPFCGQTWDHQNKVDVEVFAGPYTDGWKFFISNPNAAPIYLDTPGGPNCSTTETTQNADGVVFFNVDPGYHWILATDGTSVDKWLFHAPEPGIVYIY